MSEWGGVCWSYLKLLEPFILSPATLLVAIQNAESTQVFGLLTRVQAA